MELEIIQQKNINYIIFYCVVKENMCCNGILNEETKSA